jgi:hypothetical protein
LLKTRAAPNPKVIWSLLAITGKESCRPLDKTFSSQSAKKMFGAIPFNALRESEDQSGEIPSWCVSRLSWRQGIDWLLVGLVGAGQ